MIDVNQKTKPCPYCGGNGEVTRYSEKEWLVACRNNMECKLLPATPVVQTAEEAVSIWNDRWDSDKALELCGKALELCDKALEFVKMKGGASNEEP